MQLKEHLVTIPKRFVVFIGTIFVLIAFFNTFIKIDSGTIGVIRRFGRINKILQPGLNFAIPFVDRVTIYNTQKIIYETSEYPSESMASYTDFPVDSTTNDGQPILIKYSIRFSIDPNQAEWIANNLGEEDEIVEKIVKMASRTYVRGVVREYKAADLYTGNITEVQEEVGKQLMEKFEENGLIFDEFGIRNIDFSQDYVDAIEQKQIEKEKVTTEKYIAEQEQYKKEASITKAQGDAETQRLLQETITDQILQKMWIEKWDGQLPNVINGESEDLILDISDVIG